MLAQCMPIVEKDDKLAAARRQAEIAFYADQAMAMLRDAVAKGYKDADHMQTDKDLDPLRRTRGLQDGGRGAGGEGEEELTDRSLGASISQAAAGGVLTAKQAPAGQAPLRRSVCARDDVFFIVSQTSSRKEKHHVVLFLAAKLETLRARGAPAHTNVPSPTGQIPPAAGSDRRSLPDVDGHRANQPRVRRHPVHSGPGSGPEPGQSLGAGRQSHRRVVGGQRGHGHQHAVQHLDFASYARLARLSAFRPAPRPLRHGTPTGIVYNTSGTGFDVSENGKTGSSVFLFATADGTISGWSPSVDSTHAVIGATNPGAIYTGPGHRHGSPRRNAAVRGRFRQGHHRRLRSELPVGNDPARQLHRPQIAGRLRSVQHPGHQQSALRRIRPGR